MAIKCPDCGHEFDITLFEFGRDVICPCGRKITAEHRENILKYPDLDVLEKEIFREAGLRERKQDWERMDRIRREADRITINILYSDLPRVDVEIAIRAFRSRVLENFPGKRELFDGIYLARFRRMWKQFRDDAVTLLQEEES
jgi:DNA-directed RNA polymerase subunit RPC12/RpoP